MTNHAVSLTDKDLDTIIDFMKTESGVTLTDKKRDMVYARLMKRLRALNLDSFSAYCELIQSDAGRNEREFAINALTTNLTSLFREVHHFEHLREEVLTPLAQDGPAAPRFRIWSSACSTGEEAYSIALTLRTCVTSLERWDAKILATDIDTNVLSTASMGHYRQGAAEKVPTWIDRRDLMNHDRKTGMISFAPSVRNLIVFKQLNLMERWPMKGPFDAIFCRNVLIYFDKETQGKLVNRFADLLRPDGFLYIGHSENLAQITNKFRLCGKSIYQKL